LTHEPTLKTSFLTKPRSKLQTFHNTRHILFFQSDFISKTSFVKPIQISVLLVYKMASSEAIHTLPPDLFDQTTLVSLSAVLVILGAAWGVSRRALAPSTPGSLRFLFIWHAFDALIHFCLEGSFLYHCFFSYLPISEVDDLTTMHPTPFNYLGYSDRIYGSQSGGDNPLARLWMVYARADKRWAGADLVSTLNCRSEAWLSACGTSTAAKVSKESRWL
jgi:hypothetical protein